ncbi:hypothetical protein V8D89_002196 [Ganoderma adspersum]
MAALEPPDDLLCAFKYPPELPVSDLLSWPYEPRRPGSRKVNLPELDWFSPHPPSVNTLTASDIILPSRKVCVALDSLLLCAVKVHGHQSIQHPIKEDVYLPLWIARIWKWAEALVQAQELWRGRLNWLARVATSEGWAEGELEAAEAVVLTSPVMAGFGPLQRGAVSSSVLAKNLLSNAWLHDESMNAVVDVLQYDMLAANNHTAMIASTYLRNVLIRPSSSTHQYYAQQLASGLFTRLLIPCNIRNVHWIPVEVDVPTKTISTGDSLPRVSKEHLPGLVRDIRTFLSYVFPGKQWHLRSNVLETGLQADTISCGIATLNAIERRVLVGAPRWSPQKPGKMRTSYYHRCLELGRRGGSQVSDGLVADGPPKPAVDEQQLPKDDTVQVGITGMSEDIALASDYAPSCSSSSSESETDDQDETPDPPDEVATKVIRSGTRTSKCGKSTTSRLPFLKVSAPIRIKPPEPKWFADHAFQTFRRKIQDDDPRADFSRKSQREVICSRCLKPVTMRKNNDTLRWKEHRHRPGTAQKHQPRSNPVPGPPCPGLGFVQDERIPKYLARTVVPCGGARRRDILKAEVLRAHARTGRRKQLSLKQLNLCVLAAERAEAQWFNHHTTGTVTSSECQRRGHLSSSGDILPCSDCMKVLKLKLFMNALRKAPPQRGYAKFTPKAYRNPVVGEAYLRHRDVQELMEMSTEQGTRWLTLAKRGIQGRYDDRQAFLGVLDTTMKIEERLHQGKSLKNIKYDASYDDVCTQLALISPRAYGLVRAEFGGRSLRSMQQHRAKRGKFKAGIVDENFDAARSWADSLGWTGPFILAVDDTKITPALRSFRDNGVWHLGGIHGVVHTFSSYEELQELAKVDKGDIAEKVRAWLLMVPIAGIPPRLVATIALKNSVSRPELRRWHDEVQDKLTARSLHIVSYNVDGVETERGLTHELQRDAFNAGRVHTWSFKHPVPGQAELLLKAPTLQNGRPCIMSSDGKHAKKNGRGSATSGTRVLCPGRYLIHFGQLAALAEGEDSPLLKSDIVGVDKQDDRAAARLFSSATIQYIEILMPEELGLTVYLYVLGDLVDAQQNRTLTHCERVKMLWRGRFFLDGWRQYVLRHPYYSVQTHFITRELYDILSIFINAMLLLILTHRDFFPDVPLFHWLNSTEANEHLFGCARKIQKDFTFVDWILMAQKVAVLMGGELASNLQAAQARARAGRHGYHHSWCDAHGINIENLSRFPSNPEFEEMIKVAHTEATTLLHILGVETSAIPVVDEEGFADALAMLTSDPEPASPNEQTSKAPQSKAELLAQLLQMDKDQFTAGQFHVDSDEKLTNLGIHATVTAIHDQLELERVLGPEDNEEPSTTPYREHIAGVLDAVTRELKQRKQQASPDGGDGHSGGSHVGGVAAVASGPAPSTVQTNSNLDPTKGESASTKNPETYTETMARLRTPLSYGTARSFNFSTVIQERQRHETREAKSAITYRFNNAVATGALASLKSSGWQDAPALLETEESEELKAALVSQMTHALSATVLSDGKSDGKADATGVERRVRWRGGEEKGRGDEGAGETGAPQDAPKKSA